MATCVALSPSAIDVPLQLHQHLGTSATVEIQQRQTQGWPCTYPFCDKTFPKKSRLDYHIRSHHTNARPFVCSYAACGRAFLRKDHLNHHVKSQHTNQRVYSCQWEGCDKTFVNAQRLKRHQDAHQGREKHKCRDFPPCSATFRKDATLKRHIAKVHLKQKPFGCNLVDEITGRTCQAAYDSVTRLKDHQVKVHSGHRYHCAVCDNSVSQTGDLEVLPSNTSFATFAELQKHNKEVHPPRCEECDVIFSSAQHLHSHIDAQHSQKSLESRKVFHCTEEGCGKSFTKASNLSTHTRTIHKAEKPFKCGGTDLSQSKFVGGWDGHNACGATFTAKASLEKHVDSRHMRNKDTVQKKGARKERRAQAKSKENGVSLLAKLTGIGLAEQGGRDVSCVVPGCDHVFKREYDMRVHAQAVHRMQESQIAEALAEREALSGGKFWLGGFDVEHDIAEEEGSMDPTMDELFRQDDSLFLGEELDQQFGEGDRYFVSGDHSQAEFGDFIDPNLMDLH